MTVKDVRQIIKEIDYFGNGMINYSEFMAATISVHKHLTEEKLDMLFNQFDLDTTGKVSP